MSNNQPEKILVIDDDEINNFISKKLIKKASKDTRITVCLNRSTRTHKKRLQHQPDPKGERYQI